MDLHHENLPLWCNESTRVFEALGKGLIPLGGFPLNTLLSWCNGSTQVYGTWGKGSIPLEGYFVNVWVMFNV